MKNQYRGGHWLKRGTWTVCQFKRGLARKWWFFEGGVDTPMHTMSNLYKHVSLVRNSTSLLFFVLLLQFMAAHQHITTD